MTNKAKFEFIGIVYAPTVLMDCRGFHFANAIKKIGT